MPSTYSSNLKLELMATGENSGTWGNITNTNFGTAVEQAIVGYGAVNYVSDANLTISISNSNSAQAARALVLNVTSALSLTQTRELVVPTIEKQYIVQNNTTGSQSITVKTSAGTGITVPNGRKAHLYVDGTNVIQMFDFVDINGGTIDGTPIGGSSAAAGSFTTLGASGAATFNGNVTLGDAAADLVVFNGTVNSHLLFTDNTFDIGANGATRPRNLFLAGNATVGGNLSVGGTLTLTGGVNLNGNVTVGDSSSDTLTINSTITSNLLFTDNTYDIGASGATRPRNLFLAGNATIGGSQTLIGALTVDSTTDSSSTTTGSIQTDGGLGVAKALFVGTTADIAGAVTLGGGTANGVPYLNGSKVLTTGSALTFDGTNLGVGTASPVSIGGYGIITPNGASGGAVYFQQGGVTRGRLITTANELTLGTTVATNPIVFELNNAEQMRLTSTGLGIGTSSPGARLHVDSAATGLMAILNSTNANGGYITGQSSSTAVWDIGTAKQALNVGGATDFGINVRNGFLSLGTGNTERARITSDGNLAVGSTTASARIHSTVADGTYPLAVSGTTKGIRFETNANESRILGVDNTLNGSYQPLMLGGSVLILASSGNTERARIDSSGNLLVGTTSTSFGTQGARMLSSGQVQAVSSSGNDAFAGYRQTTTAGDSIITGYSNVGGTQVLKFNAMADGNVRIAAGATYGNISDQKYKTNIVDATPKLQDLMQLRVRNFNVSGSEQKAIGFIAQEFETVFPSLVIETADKDFDGNDLGTTTKGIKESALIPVLVKAIQEQQALITALTARVAQLESN